MSRPASDVRLVTPARHASLTRPADQHRLQTPLFATHLRRERPAARAAKECSADILDLTEPEPEDESLFISSFRWCDGHDDEDDDQSVPQQSPELHDQLASRRICR